MSIVVLGVNHHTSPLELLERMAVGAADLHKTLFDLCECSHVNEAVVLSTCNRTEVYAVAERFHGAYGDIRDVLCRLADVAPEDLHPHLYSQHDDGAVSHLFEVAAGVDSAVVGETEILGQVRLAWERAQGEGAARVTLNLLFRHAVEVGKRVRTDTAISRGTVSVSHAAVEMATGHLGSLRGQRVLLVGAGDMGQGMAKSLALAGAADVAVANRTRERAELVAERIGGRVVSFDSLATAMREADVVLTCTGAGSLVIDREMIGHRRQPLLVVDIGIPRDVDADVGQLPGVTLLDLDDLGRWAARGVEQRAAEVDAVRAIVTDEVDRYRRAATARQAAPVIAQLHRKAEAIRRAELDRQATRLGDLTDDEREAVETLSRGIVAKLLNDPAVRLKEEAGTPRGERDSAAVRHLFDLH